MQNHDLANRDLAHLNAFPEHSRDRIMRTIMQRPVDDERICDGDHCYENTVTRLHARGFELIDLQPQEAAFTTVWYRGSKSWFGLRLSETAAMLVWEFNGSNERTTVREWRL